MPSTEKHLFVSRVMQRKTMQDIFGQPLQIRGREDVPMVPIRFRFYKQIRIGCRLWNAQTAATEPFIMLAENIIEFGLPLIQSMSEQLRQTVEEQLMEMGVPEDEMTAIYHKLLKVVKVTFPIVPVSVLIVDVTLHISKPILAPITVIIGCLLKNNIICSHGWEGIETFVIFRATKLPGLEADVRKTECTICLDQVGVVEVEQGVDYDDEQLIVRLHCSHLFHRDCIVRWLKTSQGCPICRRCPCPCPGCKGREHSGDLKATDRVRKRATRTLRGVFIVLSLCCS